MTDDKQLKLLKEKYERHEQILVQSYKSLKQKEQELKRMNEVLLNNEQEIQEKNEDLQAINEELTATMQHLQETQAELLQSEKMASLGILTAGVAHEINNPLNYIMGSYIGLKNYFTKYPPEEQEEIDTLLSSLEEGVDRASTIVTSLNQFSRSNTNNKEHCSISSIIDNCLVILNNKMKYRIEVQKDYCSDSDLVIGNVGKIHQIFINVLSNAQQAIPAEGVIRVSTKTVGRNIIATIEDTGVGISKDNIHKISDPFFTTKAPGEGTGLGLTITYNLVREHQAKIFFHSEEGKGTRVEIIFTQVVKS